MMQSQGVIGSDVSDVVLPLRRIKWQEAIKRAPNTPVAFAKYQGRDDMVGKMVGGVRYTNNDYSNMLKDLLDRGDVCKYALEQGAVSAIKMIGQSRVRFVTSLKADAAEHLRTMLERCGLTTEVVSTGGKSKLPHVKSFVAFIDNSADELYEMRGLVPVRILFDLYGDTASKTQSIPRGVESAKSWSDIVRILQRHELMPKAA